MSEPFYQCLIDANILTGDLVAATFLWGFAKSYTPMYVIDNVSTLHRLQNATTLGVCVGIEIHGPLSLQQMAELPLTLEQRRFVANLMPFQWCHEWLDGPEIDNK